MVAKQSLALACLLLGALLFAGCVQPTPTASPTAVVTAPPTGTPIVAPTAPGEIPKGPFDFLLVSNRGGLRAKYGNEIAQQVENEMNTLAQTVQRTDGKKSAVIMLDDTRVVQGVGGTPLRSNSPDDVLLTIRSLTTANNPAFLLIVGGDRIVSFQRVPNPIAEFPDGIPDFIIQEDPVVPSDHPYSMRSCNDKYQACAPEIAVGRLPDGNEEHSSSILLVDLLRLAQQRHSSKPTTPSAVSKPVSADSIASYYSKFDLTGPQEIVPPFQLVNFNGLRYEPNSLAKVENLFESNTATYLSLHGNLPDAPQALEGRSPDGEMRGLVVTAKLAAEFKPQGLFVADSCHAAHPSRAENEALWISLLRKGAVGFVGSSVTAFSDGSVGDKQFNSESDIEALGLANSLSYFTIKNYKSGMSLGQALAAAKRKINPGKSAADKLTVLEFLLYGDPTIST